MLHLYLSRIPPCLTISNAVRLLSVSVLDCLHLRGIFLLDCLLGFLSIAGDWPRMPSPLVGTRLADFSALICTSPIWYGQCLAIPISIHCQSATNTPEIVHIFISLARFLVVERLEPWSSLHLVCPSSGVHHRLLPPLPTISTRFYPSSPAPPVVLSSYVTRQRCVSDRPIFSWVRRYKGVCGVTGEASDKLLFTLTYDTSTVTTAGGPELQPSHLFPFKQVSPLIILIILWVIYMGLEFMNQRYLFDLQYTVGKLRVSEIWIA